MSYDCAMYYWFCDSGSVAKFFWVSHRFWVKCLCWLTCYVSQLLIHPAILCFIWLALGLCQLRFFLASWLLVRLSRRKREDKDLLSSLLLAILIDSSPSSNSSPQFQLLLALTEWGSWYFRGKSNRLAATPPQKSKTQLLNSHNLSFHVLIFVISSLYFPSFRDDTCFLGYLYIFFFFRIQLPNTCVPAA